MDSAILVHVDQHTTGKCPPGDHRAAGMRTSLPSANRSTVKSHLQNAHMLLEAHKHWCKPSLLPYEVLQGPRGPSGSVEEVHLALGTLFPQEPPKCSLQPSIARSFPQEGPCFLKWGWNVPESPCLTLLCIVIYCLGLSFSASLTCLVFFFFSQEPMCSSSQLVCELLEGWIFLGCFLVCKNYPEEEKN